MKKLLLLSVIILLSKMSFGQTVSPDSTLFYEGKEITMSGKVTSTFVTKGEKSKVLINFGNPHPNESFTLVIESADLSKFKYDPAEFLKDKKVVVKGKVKMYKDKPEMMITSPDQITIK
jgi:RecG-like helicase